MDAAFFYMWRGRWQQALNIIAHRRRSYNVRRRGFNARAAVSMVTGIPSCFTTVRVGRITSGLWAGAGFGEVPLVKRFRGGAL